ncbi:MAG: N-acetylmuramoyl-L-alanine amidase [Thermoanaerobaculia bacterium]|nr:N-acetylmuramoyl-L-alanine amidase [Thermoanaerobaculia bacterium]
MSRGTRRALALASVAWLLCAAAVVAETRAAMGAGRYAALTPAGELILEAPPLREEGLIRFVQRLCADAGAREEVSRINGGVTRLQRGVRYKVPFDLLKPQLQLDVVRALFGDSDRVSRAGWTHVVTTPDASLWTLAEWFTGSGDNFRALRDRNELSDEGLRIGQEILIPRDLLRSSLVAGLPVPVTAATPFAGYGRDGEGEYAVYELRRGEALYSSVVVRFTARIHADDVNGLARRIAERSDIRDVRNIPVGYPVKIPLEELAPEFLPPDHPQRVEYEEGLSRSAQYANQTRSRDLEGVTVVLDAGHGGRDVGAAIDGIWESVYVYDIMLRTRRLLEKATSANVVVTTRDGSDFDIAERDVLPASRGHKVLTRPPYAIEDSRVSSNLRWYLSNSIYSQTLQSNGRSSSDRVVFLSIHADSLHPSIRGAMVYVPGLLRNPPNYGKTGTVYTSRKEVQERPRVNFSRDERVRSEGLSRDLAGEIISSFRRSGLAIHPNQPIRDRVIRSRRAWVPAVLRFNAVPSKVLVEVCNLANTEDRRLVQTRDFRERVAAAIVEGIVAYYGGSAGGPQVASQ